MLQSLYNVVITTEFFDKIKLFGIGDKIIANKKQRNLAAVQFELEQFIESQTIDLDTTDSLILTALIKNQYTNSNESNTVLNNCVRLLSTTVAKNILDLRGIIGIQPMSSPVKKVYQLAYTSDESCSLQLEVLSNTIEAMTRQVQVNFSIEAAQDLNSIYGLDIEKEILSTISTEITSEITQQVITELQTLAKYHEVRTIKRDVDRNQHAIGFICSLTQEANGIAAETRRGQGNYIICHPSSLSNVIQNCLASNMGFKLTKKHLDNPENYEFHHAGTITGFEQVKKFDVYVSAHMPKNEGKDTILIGYKGISELDTGYILAPYIPVTSKGVIINKLTFQPVVKLVTRYGKFVYINPSEDTKSSMFVDVKPTRLSDSTQYYRMIEIEHFDI